jgi:transposase
MLPLRHVLLGYALNQRVVCVVIMVVNGLSGRKIAENWSRSIKIHYHHQQQSHERAFAHNLPGLQSVSREQMDSNTFEIVSAGLHWSYERAR